jgi:3-oxoacyl-[acyl-carrier protein] reductase
VGGAEGLVDGAILMTEKRTALVTGGSRGIGAAIVRRLATDGLHVIALARNAERLAEVCAAARDAGGSAEPAVCDIANPGALAASIERAIESHGHLDVLVNNAGITRDGLILRMDDADFDAVIATNLKSAFVAIRAAARSMIRLRGSIGGRIINITSVAGVAGNAGQANYAASKAGLIGLTKSVAKELASKNVTCNAVAPGFIQTDMTEALNEQVKETARGHIPLRRFGNPEDVAAVVSFLAGPDAAYITGQVICVDGGMVM